MADPTITVEYVENLAKGAAARSAYEAKGIVTEEQIQSVMSRQAQWTSVDGVKVKRIGSERFVAVPCSGRENSAKFDIIDLDDRSEIVCTLNKKEVQSWLYAAGA